MFAAFLNNIGSGPNSESSMALFPLPTGALFYIFTRMELYDQPTFRMACQQFDLVADQLQIPLAERDRIKFPKRSMAVALPIHMDDGSTRVFPGDRVQH